jgi:hypothetical protein
MTWANVRVSGSARLESVVRFRHLLGRSDQVGAHAAVGELQILHESDPLDVVLMVPSGRYDRQGEINPASKDLGDMGLTSWLDTMTGSFSRPINKYKLLIINTLMARC